MLFGMFKEKEVIENTNFDTTKGDIVEDFGGVINNQSNDKDLIPLTSFSESHSEDINYQNADLNNPQTIINSINGNSEPQNTVINNQPIQPTPNVSNIISPNYQKQPIQSNVNNQNMNIQNEPMNNQPVINSNFTPQQYVPYPTMNVNATGIQPMPNNQNVQIPNPTQFGYNNVNPNIPINNMKSAIQPNNEQNIINNQPVQPIFNVPNQNIQTQSEIQPNIGTQNIPINDTVQTLDSNVEIENQNNDNEIPNSPVKILTEVPEKKGRTDLTSALLGAPQVSNIPLDTKVPSEPINIEQPNMNINQTEVPINNLQPEVQPISNIELPPVIDQQLDNISNINIQQPQLEVQELQSDIPNIQTNDVSNTLNTTINDIPKSIDDEIKNTPIPSMISLLPTMENQSSISPADEKFNDNNINLTNNVELPQTVNPITPKINDEKQENIVKNDIKQPVVEATDTNTHEHEHKFIISDNVDVEPGFKICPKCGQKIRDDYRLCFVCGTYF